jgi:hypothetical protein
MLSLADVSAAGHSLQGTSIFLSQPVDAMGFSDDTFLAPPGAVINLKGTLDGVAINDALGQAQPTAGTINPATGTLSALTTDLATTDGTIALHLFLQAQ